MTLPASCQQTVKNMKVLKPAAEGSHKNAGKQWWLDSPQERSVIALGVWLSPSQERLLCRKCGDTDRLLPEQL